jgi:hypothetical protein
MITLSITVNDVNTVIAVGYDKVEIARASAIDVDENGLPATVGPYVIKPGLDVALVNNVYTYQVEDPNGSATDWYISRYVDNSPTISGMMSSWSDPILGEAGDLLYSPLYPKEITYDATDQLIIDRIRRLIGDPIGLRREFGDDAVSSIQPDNRTYELDEKGWPVSVTLGVIPMNSSSVTTMNGYRYLQFRQDITVTTVSGGIEYGLDVWYHTFRHSDREIMAAYDNCPPPIGLTTTTATSEAYMLQTAIELIQLELWEDAVEDGAELRDEGSHYDPAAGLEVRRKLIDNLQKKLDDLVKTLILGGVTGVLID